MSLYKGSKGRDLCIFADTGSTKGRKESVAKNQPETLATLIACGEGVDPPPS